MSVRNKFPYQSVYLYLINIYYRKFVRLLTMDCLILIQRLEHSVTLYQHIPTALNAPFPQITRLKQEKKHLQKIQLSVNT